MSKESLIGALRRFYKTCMEYLVLFFFIASIASVLWLLFYLDHVRFVL